MHKHFFNFKYVLESRFHITVHRCISI